MKTALTILLALWSISTATAQSLEEKISPLLSKVFSLDEPGASVIVVKEGRTLFRQGYGMANLELEVKIKPEMVFRLGSITKQFTAAAILMLEEEGKLSVTDSITKHLPSYPTQGHTITIEHLLTHTPGIVSYTGIQGYFREKIKRDLRTDQLLGVFKDLPAEFPPGTKWKYNNSGYVILGAIIEKISGQSYAEFIQSRVFQPLGMTQSHYGGNQIIPNRVAGYSWNNDHYDNAQYLSMTQPHAAGSLLSTVDDLARWYAALESNQLISAESFKRMQTPFSLTDGSATNYGYGFFTGILKSDPMIFHGGGIPGFVTYSLFLPEKNIVVAILTNRTGKGPRLDLMAQRIAAIAINNPFKEWAKKKVSDTIRRRYVGEYIDAHSRSYSLEVKNGGLYLKLPDGSGFHGHPASDSEFFSMQDFSYFKMHKKDDSWDLHLHKNGTSQPVVAIQKGALASQESMIEAIKHGNASDIATHIQNDLNLEERDSDGNTPLHWACLSSDLELAAQLLSRGADVNALNDSGATPLIYATGSLPLVRLLIEHGANINHLTELKSTPLLTASRRPKNFEVVQFLIENGADPKLKDGAKNSALDIASVVGDIATVDLLLEQGLSPSSLRLPARSGRIAIVERLINTGLSVNHPTSFTGSALNAALYGQSTAMARFLIDSGADLTTRSPAGQHETPPILWAAYNEKGDASVAKAMIARGADVNTLSALGESALDWATERNNTELVKVLLDAGAKHGTKKSKNKEIPSRSLPHSPDAFTAHTYDAVEKALSLLQQSSDNFLRSPIAKRQRCVTCHQQTLPAVAFASALQRGFKLDETSIARQIQDQIRFWSRSQKVSKAYELIRPQPDFPISLGYGLWGLSALSYPADKLTDAMGYYLSQTQDPNGSWTARDYRPPVEDGPIQGAAFTIRSLTAYPPSGQQKFIPNTIQRAREFLLESKPTSFNQQVFQFLGLLWSDHSGSELDSLRQSIIEKQQPDGGWPPLKGIQNDAWATGQALFALYESGLKATDPVYQRGIRFLLRTQFEDGSWYVKSRSWPFQPHFESGFPHGKDQWISASATAWACMALLNTLPKSEHHEAVDWMKIKVPIQATESAPALDKTSDNVSVHFARDIQPFLNRSCGKCHGETAKPKKGGFSIDSPSDFLKGGQSQSPVAIRGQSHKSEIIRMVTDQIEDLEMPPLSKRPEQPALSKDEVDLLKTWIDEGLPD